MDHPVALNANKRTPTSNSSSKKNSFSSAKHTNPTPVTTSASSPAGFNFITVDPSSRSESSTSRTLIRANAGRYIWKRRKASSSKESGGRAKPYEKPSSQRNAAAIKAEPSSPPEDNSQALEDLPRVKEEDEDEDEEQAVTVAKKNTSTLGPRRRTTRRLDPTTGINHGLRSPLFTSFGTEVPEEIVRRTFKYCQFFPFTLFTKYTLRHERRPLELTKTSGLCGHGKNASIRCRWPGAQGI